MLKDHTSEPDLSKRLFMPRAELGHEPPHFYNWYSRCLHLASQPDPNKFWYKKGWPFSRLYDECMRRARGLDLEKQEDHKKMNARDVANYAIAYLMKFNEVANWDATALSETGKRRLVDILAVMIVLLVNRKRAWQDHALGYFFHDYLTQLCETDRSVKDYLATEKGLFATQCLRVSASSLARTVQPDAAAGEEKQPAPKLRYGITNFRLLALILSTQGLLIPVNEGGKIGEAVPILLFTHYPNLRRVALDYVDRSIAMIQEVDKEEVDRDGRPMREVLKPKLAESYAVKGSILRHIAIDIIDGTVSDACIAHCGFASLADLIIESLKSYRKADDCGHEVAFKSEAALSHLICRNRVRCGLTKEQFLTHVPQEIARQYSRRRRRAKAAAGECHGALFNGTPPPVSQSGGGVVIPKAESANGDRHGGAEVVHDHRQVAP